MRLMITTATATAAAMRPRSGHLRTMAPSTVTARFMHTVRREGQPETPDCRYFFYDALGRKQSPWHHIPLFAQASHDDHPHVHEAASHAVCQFVAEIPRGARAKLEIAGHEEFNPIRQDLLRSGQPRFYHYDSLVNYGCLPQTWEDPDHVDEDTKCGGDNDPLDVVEIGSRMAAVGDVYPVKVLGVLAMIDDGETDWKIIAINVNDPLAKHVHDVADLQHTPLHGAVDDIHRWFRDYKLPDGKRASEFAFDGRAMPRDFALDVIHQTHESWKELVGGGATASAKHTDFWTGHPPRL